MTIGKTERNDVLLTMTWRDLTRPLKICLSSRRRIDEQFAAGSDSDTGSRQNIVARQGNCFQ